MNTGPEFWLDKIRALPQPARSLRIMNVCGGHERTISRAGLRKALPAWLQLIPGPGCPVCVCPEEDIRAAIQLALRDDIILAAFGDMLRVPCNAPKRHLRTLQEAQALGARVVAIASPAEVITLAETNPRKSVVFFAAGFETTAAPLAALLSTSLPDNLQLLLSLRQTWPAVAHLLNSGDASFDALVAPGHVATIMGAEQWRFIPESHGLPVAIGGFTPALLLQAIHSVLVKLLENRPALDNCYPQSVKTDGNPRARQLLADMFEIKDANWRGIGALPQSGFFCKPHLAQRDARLLYPEVFQEVTRTQTDMPAGCDCAAVILGKITPPQCRLYGTACKPANPIGPCMVSEEGSCRIWWSSGITTQRRA
jgi:hydrogenase expression/formation protein HypD